MRKLERMHEKLRATVGGQTDDPEHLLTVVPRSAGNGKEPFQCRIIGHPNQTLVPDGIYERVAPNEDMG